MQALLLDGFVGFWLDGYWFYLFWVWVVFSDVLCRLEFAGVFGRLLGYFRCELWVFWLVRGWYNIDFCVLIDFRLLVLSMFVDLIGFICSAGSLVFVLLCGFVGWG